MKNIFRIGSLNFISNNFWFLKFLNLNIIAFIFKVFNKFLLNYPSSTNLSYLWNFGFLSLICLIIQIVTGIFLSMHYVADVNLAFASIEHIIRDVNYGWFIRYIHLNGASFFFIVVYIHIFRGFYYSSYTYPRQLVWATGIIIWILMILTAFLGYVLPWGQMSFWAATVITNLASSIPVIGTNIVYWVWGGFAVNQATLNRFFSLHYLLPFVILALSMLHMIFLHEFGSNNPLGIFASYDYVFLYPHYVLKDVFGLIVLVIFGSIFVFFLPNYLGHSDNYILANPMVTPPHIVPEWYFLPFYAILRSVPNKLLGVVLMLTSIVIFLFLPFVIWFNRVRSFSFKPLHKIIFFMFVLICIFLTWLGGCPVTEPYYSLSQIFTVAYFSIFLIVAVLSYFELRVLDYYLYKENYNKIDLRYYN